MQSSKKKKLTQERLREILDYDPETGIFIWRKYKTGSGYTPGAIAGCKGKEGYISIKIDNSYYAASRLAFLWTEGYFPEHEVDHRDRIRDNNKWSNLREVSRVCNMRNCGINKRNKSGVTGICWSQATNKWQATIRVFNKQVYLGVFEDIVLAAKARWGAEVKYGWPNCNSTSSAYQYLQKHQAITSPPSN